jgi:GTP cyclohydrolase IA
MSHSVRFLLKEGMYLEGEIPIGIEDSLRHVLMYIGEDPKREGLKQTPARVVRAWQELFSGYGQRVEDVFTTFEDGACDDMVVLRNIEFCSTCEHHMLPFMGTAHIAYLPSGKVIGVSKLARLLEIYTRRLQIQERIGMQVTKALDEHLGSKGSACILVAKHLCMTCRGVNKQQSEMVTSSITGGFKENPAVRAELLSLIGVV